MLIFQLDSPQLMHFKITLLCDEWGSLKGGLSTINRKLAIEFAKDADLKVMLFMPKCSKKARESAKKHQIKVFTAQPVSDSEKWWAPPPPELKSTDFIIGHSVVLGKAAPDLRKHYQCKWIQIVHTDAEELGNFKGYTGASVKGEEELRLCRKADLVVGIGPKLTESFSAALGHKKEKCLTLTPGIFSEYSKIEHPPNLREDKFRVLTFGRSDPEDLLLKGYDIAAQAIAQLNDKSYLLIFVGATSDVEHRKTFRKTLLDYGISENQLKIRGFKKSQQKLAEVFQEADLVIMPSRSEGFGLSGLEGLSAGLPILVSGDSGLAKALYKLPNGSSCVVDPDANASPTQVINEWAREIKKVRQKQRKVRLDESKLLRGHYGRKYSWPKQCECLVKEMEAMVRGYSITEGKDSSNLAKDGNLFTTSPPPKRPRVYPSQGTSHEREVEEGTDDDEVDSDESSSDSSDDDLQESSGQPMLAEAPCSGKFKAGVPSENELDELAGKIVPVWRKLGIRLGIASDKLDEIDASEKDKPMAMLLHWTQTKASESTYEALYPALCHERVGRRDLAEKFCLET